MSIPSYRIFYEYILESACRSATVAACLSLSPSHYYQHARNLQYLFGADFQSKCNACEQKTPCGHFQPRRLRGLRLSMVWAAFASAPVAPSRSCPSGRSRAGARWRSRWCPSPGGGGARRSRRGSRGAPALLRAPAAPALAPMAQHAAHLAAARQRTVEPSRPDGAVDRRVARRQVLALLDAKMAAMGHGFLLRCMSSQAPSQDCRGSFHVLRRRCTRSESPPAIARESAYQKKLQNAQEYIKVHVSICKLAKTISYRSSREKRITR